ncbi:MAG TPA: acylphosphatase [Planctomycetota bacterium]|nr:acylphosphatase [Planctomycetota bacterium]HRR81992.1 acylphosphatase [Planctomycetota bacterium]HRT94444.1 acylphosphatase [Planctomycetota bacterium]
MAKPLGARARVVFRGQVQGVGFRYTARRAAESFAVTGYVQNEPDGSVELVAEGERDEIEAFLGAVAREMAPYIRSREVTWSVATGEFHGFGVRHTW